MTVELGTLPNAVFKIHTQSEGIHLLSSYFALTVDEILLDEPPLIDSFTLGDLIGYWEASVAARNINLFDAIEYMNYSNGRKFKDSNDFLERFLIEYRDIEKAGRAVALAALDDYFLQKYTPQWRDIKAEQRQHRMKQWALYRNIESKTVVGQRLIVKVDNVALLLQGSPECVTASFDEPITFERLQTLGQLYFAEDIIELVHNEQILNKEGVSESQEFRFALHMKSNTMLVWCNDLPIYANTHGYQVNFDGDSLFDQYVGGKHPW